MRPAQGVRIGDVYTEWALRLVEQEALLRSRLLDELPARVVDCHAHTSGRGMARDLSDYGWSQRRSSFPEWDFDCDVRVKDLLYGDREVVRLWMAQPHKGFDHQRVNDYILRDLPPGDFAILCGLPDDEQYTLERIRSGRFVALKCYPHYVEPPYRWVSEFFPDWALQACQDGAVPIILHLARPLTECVDEVLALTDKFPRLVVVLAHLGRVKSTSAAVQSAFHAVAERQCVVADTSMVTDAGVVSAAFAALGPERVLFGSDEPFCLLRYIEVVDAERGSTVVSHDDYHWNKPWAFQRYGDTARRAVLIHFQSIEALLEGMPAALRASSSAMEKVFCRNTERWFGLAERA